MDTLDIAFIICMSIYLLFFMIYIIWQIMCTPSAPDTEVTEIIKEALEKGVYMKNYPTPKNVRIKVVLKCDSPKHLVLKTDAFGGPLGIELPYRKYKKTWALNQEDFE